LSESKKTDRFSFRIDADLKRFAISYARTKGMTLSWLIEDYLRQLRFENSKQVDKEIKQL
jgi:hypothetical protein